MERTMNPEERIRRAEEIYNRRKMQGGVRVYTSNVNTKVKPEYNLLKKLVLQILICLVIYLIFYLIKNSNYIFSQDVINKTKEFLSYDINFQKIYNSGIEFYNNNIKNFIDNLEKDNNNQLNKEQQNLNQDLNTQTNSIVENENNIQENIINNQEVANEEGGIGGGSSTQTSADEVEQIDTTNLSQMEIDANEIKSNYNLIVPLTGTITSRYGPRTPTEIVSANHEGIDIGANEGTIFVAAMEGTVTSVVYGGDYGNHIYIQNGDVITLYAHCKTIYKTEGENISQGEQIGEVGSTGKATRTTFAF